jgi:archaellum biogenesis protein FlaJ (TadC family)
MEKFVAVFVSWQAIFLAFVSFIVLQLIRKVGSKMDAETGAKTKGLAQHRSFQMFLPLYPYLITLGLVFIPGTPIPEVMGTTFAVKIFFALWCGWISGFSYQIVKKILEKGFGMDFDPQMPGEEKKIISDLVSTLPPPPVS